MSEPVRVLSAAYRVDDLIVSLPAPARHGDILVRLHRLLKTSPRESGFLLSDGEFASRLKAFSIAERAGQRLPRDPKGYNGPELYSEDVW